MTMIQALNSAHGRDAGARPGRADLRRGRRLLRRRLPRHRRAAEEARRRPAASTRRSPRAASSAIAVGMGAYGLRPVVEIQFADYIYPAYDQLVSEAARLRYRSGGEFTAPITVRAPYGGGIFGGQTHSQSPEALFTHVAGLKTVIPSNPYDAKGLLISAIEDDDPVIFFEPKRHLQRPLRRPPRPAGAALGGARARRRRARGPLHRAARQGARSCAQGCGGHRAGLRHDGARVAGRGRGGRRRRRGHRSAHPGARSTSRRSPLRSKKTGRCVIVHEATAHLRLRRRAVGPGAGALLLPPRGADRARDRLGHALSARLRVGLFPGTQRVRPRRCGA